MSRNTAVTNWVLTYTGVPVLLLDTGTTRSRARRQIQLLLVEKGTCFALWRDVVDNLTRSVPHEVLEKKKRNLQKVT